MAKLTVTLDDHVLARVRCRAQSLGLSPSDLVTAYLRAWAGSDPARAIATQALLSLGGPDLHEDADAAHHALPAGLERRPRLRMVR